VVEEAQMNDTHDRIIRLETRVERIESDIESEKGTRSRANAEIMARLSQVEQTVWKGVGAVSAVVAVAGVVLTLIFKFK
jgi:hypothetical protein